MHPGVAPGAGKRLSSDEAAGARRAAGLLSRAGEHEAAAAPASGGRGPRSSRLSMRDRRRSSARSASPPGQPSSKRPIRSSQARHTVTAATAAPSGAPCHRSSRTTTPLLAVSSDAGRVAARPHGAGTGPSRTAATGDRHRGVTCRMRRPVGAERACTTKGSRPREHVRPRHRGAWAGGLPDPPPPRRRARPRRPRIALTDRGHRLADETVGKPDPAELALALERLSPSQREDLLWGLRAVATRRKPAL
jgi:hypothetical protein